MSLRNNRRREPGGLSGEAIAVWVGVIVVLLAVGPAYVAVRAGTALSGTHKSVPGNPFAVFFGLLDHSVAWPGTTGTVLLAGCYVLLLALIVLGVWAWHRRRHAHTRVDHAAAYLGRGRDVAGQSRRHVAAAASRLGVDPSTPGLPIGVTVAGGQPLLSSWEDERITIAGPRTGKTTSMVIPEILAAPGAVVATSNKRDVVDATRDVRAACGGDVWVFDPQAQVGEPPTWWWNPLSYVTDETQAKKLAQHFAAGSRDRSARVDAFFDPAGQDLLGGLLLAAALDRRPITEVYTWLTLPTERAAIDILQAGGYPLTAQNVAGVVEAPERQRGGVFGTARQMAACLTNRAVAEWVTPPRAAGRREFSPDAFVRRHQDTLYSLSREGQGTAGPLVTALTVAVMEAAERYAAGCPAGRLPVPLVGVLDEAANVCRWADLPDQYSFFGSRGIVIDTVLQSWSQGVQVWGQDGMRKLWSAANVAVYGGGVREKDFLEELARTLGDYDRLAGSTSYGRGHRSVSQQLHRDRILDVDELAALPRGRALVFASGSRPTLIRTVPWMSGPHAGAVQDSIAAHTPGVPPAALPDSHAVTSRQPGGVEPGSGWLR